MSKIRNGGLDQYGSKPFEQQQLGTAGVEAVNLLIFVSEMKTVTKFGLLTTTMSSIETSLLVNTALIVICQITSPHVRFSCIINL